jgi:hypothetical protein
MFTGFCELLLRIRETIIVNCEKLIFQLNKFHIIIIHVLYRKKKNIIEQKNFFLEKKIQNLKLLSVSRTTKELKKLKSIMKD